MREKRKKKLLAWELANLCGVNEKTVSTYCRTVYPGKRFNQLTIEEQNELRMHIILKQHEPTEIKLDAPFDMMTGIGKQMLKMTLKKIQTCTTIEAFMRSVPAEVRQFVMRLAADTNIYKLASSEKQGYQIRIPEFLKGTTFGDFMAEQEREYEQMSTVPDYSNDRK